MLHRFDYSIYCKIEIASEDDGTGFIWIEMSFRVLPLKDEKPQLKMTILPSQYVFVPQTAFSPI
ncbi:MAG: hypothetical protein ACTSX0_07035, partial [Promethearchaeota archaeon]